MTKKPKHLNWEQAAAVPLVFATVYYALYDKLKPTKGETILIHSAAGGIGQAAVLLCKHLGLRVLATCGTPEKKKMLLSQGVEACYNSRGTTWKAELLQDYPEGVNYVLNSLAGTKLQMSVECLKTRGQIVELVKDQLENNDLQLRPFLNNVSFHAVH